MRGKVWWVLLVIVCGLETVHAAVTRKEVSKVCARVVVDGEIHAGQEFRQTAVPGLEIQLEPSPAGWRLRVVATATEQGSEDLAEMATPPYRSVSPLLISTDFSFRAQDAIGWNPRHFRYAAGERSYGELRRLRRALDPGGSAARQREMELADVVSTQPEGTFDIIDAHLVPGTADQTRAASMVAGHFVTTAHSLDQPPSGRPSLLGQLTWIRFRVSLAISPRARVTAPARMERTACAP